MRITVIPTIAIVFFWLGFLNPIYAQGDNLEELFNIIAVQDLDNSTPGLYNTSEWSRDWNSPTWNNGLGNVYIVDEQDVRAMKFTYPEGTWHPFEGGAQWLAPFETGLQEVYFSYNVMFKPDFEWVLGGKLPGLGGGNNAGGVQEMAYDDGFSARVMWNKDSGGDGTMFFYVYHQDKPGYYGDVLQFSDAYWDVSDYTWYNMTMRLVVNSIDKEKLSSDPQNAGNKDGILEFFLDGKLVYSRSNMRFRNIESIFVDTRHITSFFGGTGDEWGATRDEWALFDDFYVFTYQEGVDVPRGTEPSEAGRVLDLPNFKGDVPDPSDTEAPTVPQNVRLSNSSGMGLVVTWDHSTDDVYLKGYRAMLNGEEIGTTVGNTYAFSGLTPLTTYDITVSAFDASGNESQPSTVLSATTLDPDEEAPTIPFGLEASDLTQSSVIISWIASTDNVGVTGYNIYLDGDWIGSSSNLRFPIVDLEPSTSYQITVTALDEFLNESGPSTALSVLTKDLDSEPPTTPTGILATLVSQNSISVVWNPSSDNVEVEGYRIYLNGSFLQTSASNSFTITSLNPGIEYMVSVSAYDAAMNESVLSDQISVTTRNPDETTTPAMPDVAIVELQTESLHASSKTTVNTFGHVELKDYGLVVTSGNDTTQEEQVFYADIEDSETVHRGRVTDKLQVLYDFSSGGGTEVIDISGAGTPLNLFIRDALTVEWLAGQGMSVKGNALIYSQDIPLRLIESLKESNEITMEVWIRSEEISQEGPARIFSLSKDNFNRAATLAYLGNNAFYNYVARLNTTDTDLNGTPEIVSDQDFISLNLHHVVYTRAISGDEKIYVNGVELISGSRLGDFSSMTDDYQLSISNELTGERPWRGTYYLAAIYNKALDTDEIIQNYLAGPGEIQYTLEIPVEPNKSYEISPFARTDQGVVYGDAESLKIQNVLYRPENDSIYMAIYPNPNDGNFRVYMEYPNTDSPDVSLHIADMNGRLVYWRDIDANDEFVRKEEAFTRTPDMHSGMYSVMLVVGTESIARRLIIYN